MSRQSEIRRLEDLLVAVREGRSRSLVVVGPAGIGKSWVCRRASALAEDFTVVGTRGVESEAHLGYGGLFDVLSPLLAGRLERLLEARADALRGALRIATAPAVDPFAVAVASLDLLAMAAEDAPVLVVVDDAPWVDAASLEALRFAARRLDADRVGFLFTARTELAAPFVDAGLESLWLRETARELSAAQMDGRAPLTERFEPTTNVQAAFARAWGDAGEPERATWLLAKGADGPDAQLSSGVARAARARGAPGAAAEAWRRAVLRHAERGDPSARAPDGELAPARLGLFACWMEDFDTARHELERAIVLARDRGLVSNLPLALSAMGELELRVGNWVPARAHAHDAIRLAEDADQFLHFGHTVLLVLDAAAGNADGARAYADVVLTVAARSGSRALEMHAHAGLGLLELGLDRPEAAIVHLIRTREIAERGGINEPNYVQWMPDLIESQIRAGLEDEARDTLAAFELQAQRTGRGWALASAARCRGLLAPPETADATFEEAFRLVAALPSPFERGRTDLCWGERLRRDGHRVDARRHLHDALRCFEGLGAIPWAEKAARELRSSGGRAQRGPRARSDELTAQQLQIAQMVAEGRTNRNIANSLFLSPKTIEFHLSHVYRKLHVSNRTELTRSLLTD